MFKNDDEIAKNFKMISNHGQEVKYYHKVTGCYSRLDSIQFKL
jgi:UDP-2-acetamido-2-deoxy-ribo-hexuluronate aminotransferase